MSRIGKRFSNIFVKREKADDPPPKPSTVVQINHETGDVWIPGKGSFPLVGPTAGAEYEALKKAEEKKREWNRNMRAVFSKSWRCTQCGKIIPPVPWNPKTLRFEGDCVLVTPDENLLCSRPGCLAPVVEYHGIPETDPSRIYG